VIGRDGTVADLSLRSNGDLRGNQGAGRGPTKCGIHTKGSNAELSWLQAYSARTFSGAIPFFCPQVPLVFTVPMRRDSSESVVRVSIDPSGHRDSHRRHLLSSPAWFMSSVNRAVSPLPPGLNRSGVKSVSFNLMVFNTRSHASRDITESGFPWAT
jgi:hypothetical protein